MWSSSHTERPKTAMKNFLIPFLEDAFLSPFGAPGGFHGGRATELGRSTCNPSVLWVATAIGTSCSPKPIQSLHFNHRAYGGAVSGSQSVWKLETTHSTRTPEDLSVLDQLNAQHFQQVERKNWIRNQSNTHWARKRNVVSLQTEVYNFERFSNASKWAPEDFHLH